MTASPFDLEVVALHVHSEVVCRFASTEISSRVLNKTDAANAAQFAVQLPQTAFITHFEIDVDGKVLIANVRAKEEAKKTYDDAVSRGETAGHIAENPRETNNFHISVNVAGGNEIRFKLIYQELLRRVRGVYKHIVNVAPGQPVKDLRVEVHITEPGEIQALHVPQFGPKLSHKTNHELIYNKAAENVHISKEIDAKLSRVHVKFEPTLEMQSTLGATSAQNRGLEGQLAVLYDVARSSEIGEVYVLNGHFVHFFAPPDLPFLNKAVVFALDVSGSMSGRKIEQLQTAMNSILDALNDGDSFNVVTYNTSLKWWKPHILESTETNIADAKHFVDALQADGGTDIHTALIGSVECLLKAKCQDSASTVILLTDGQPTNGITVPEAIVENLQRHMANAGETAVTVHCLGFGADADFTLLQKVSLCTNGLTRKIFEDADADIQLKGFYDEIGWPLLANLKIKYLDPTLVPDSVVQNVEGDYYRGSEKITAGRVGSAVNFFQTCIMGRRTTGNVSIDGCLKNPEILSMREGTLRMNDVLERTWAYLTLKKMFSQIHYELKDEKEIAEVKKKALELSLKYHFVTELTSMVVTLDDHMEKSIENTTGDPLFSLRTYALNASACTFTPSMLMTQEQPYYARGMSRTGGLISLGSSFAGPPGGCLKFGGGGMLGESPRSLSLVSPSSMMHVPIIGARGVYFYDDAVSLQRNDPAVAYVDYAALVKRPHHLATHWQSLLHSAVQYIKSRPYYERLTQAKKIIDSQAAIAEGDFLILLAYCFSQKDESASVVWKSYLHTDNSGHDAGSIVKTNGKKAPYILMTNDQRTFAVLGDVPESQATPAVAMDTLFMHCWRANCRYPKGAEKVFQLLEIVAYQVDFEGRPGNKPRPEADVVSVASTLAAL